MDIKNDLPVPSGAGVTQTVTKDIASVDSAKAGMTGALLFILGAALFLGVSILVVILDESPAAVTSAYIGIGLFLISFFMLFRQYMVKQVDAFFSPARTFIEPLFSEGERFLAVTWFRRLGLSFSSNLDIERGLLVFTTHRLFILKMTGVYAKILENSPESINIGVCDIGSHEKVRPGWFIMPPTHMFFLKKLYIVPEGEEKRYPLGFFKVGINGRTIRLILRSLCTQKGDRQPEHLKRKSRLLMTEPGVIEKKTGEMEPAPVSDDTSRERKKGRVFIVSALATISILAGIIFGYRIIISKDGPATKEDTEGRLKEFTFPRYRISILLPAGWKIDDSPVDNVIRVSDSSLFRGKSDATAPVEWDDETTNSYGPGFSILIEIHETDAFGDLMDIGHESFLDFFVDIYSSSQDDKDNTHSIVEAVRVDGMEGFKIDEIRKPSGEDESRSVVYLFEDENIIYSLIFTHKFLTRHEGLLEPIAGSLRRIY